MSFSKSTRGCRGKSPVVSTIPAGHSAACPPPPDRPLILDKGCGPRAQTLYLHQLSPAARIVALDNHRPYLRVLQNACHQWHDPSAIHPVCADMNRPDFQHGIFDLIWSEGAIYQAGFGPGLRAWRDLLKPNGRLAVSEIAWRRPDPPPAVRAFWEEGYPAMQDNRANLAAIREEGYRLSGNFFTARPGLLERVLSPPGRSTGGSPAEVRRLSGDPSDHHQGTGGDRSVPPVQ
ncbi:MAG: methyltransferase domain-containing protein [Acidobacteria bacterium]|nr:methyltransferase domain-containing protein [Acidobacteriota bacterium]